MSQLLLSALLIVPLIGIVIVVLTPSHNKELLKWVAFVTTLINLLLSLPLYFNFVGDAPGYQFEEFAAWIPAFNINYHVGIDGLSLFLVLLTTFLSAVAVLSSWMAITEQVKEYMALMLVLETAMIGVFVSLDLFLFYLFWETSLIPMALLIGRWGGKRRIYASIKFILYTMAGSTLMLVAALVVYAWGGTSDLPTLVANLELPVNLQVWLFFCLCPGFCRKKCPSFRSTPGYRRLTSKRPRPAR